MDESVDTVSQSAGELEITQEQQVVEIKSVVFR